MNNISGHLPEISRINTTQEPALESSTTGSVSTKEQLKILAKDGKPQKILDKDAAPLGILVKHETKSNTIKKAIISFFDDSLKEEKTEKMKDHKKEIAYLFQSGKCELNIMERDQLTNEPAFVAETLNKMLHHIDLAKKCKTKDEKQALLNKMSDFMGSPAVQSRLGGNTLNLMMNIGSIYLDVKLRGSNAKLSDLDNLDNITPWQPKSK